MSLAIPAPEQVTLPVARSNDLFPVRRIYCVGRNYAAHAREMGKDPDRESPFFFLKPADTIIHNGADFPYPTASNDVHHEIEMVVALKGGGREIPEDEALSHVFGYAVGIDMTRRDLQARSKEMARPWDAGKAFDHAAPCALLHPVDQVGHPASGEIWLQVNGDDRQRGDLGELIWNVPKTISCLSGLFTLHPGDLIYTGTPAGVGPVQRGDVMIGGIHNLGEIRIQVV